MLKKKNMAIMMAVATVATTVAPAFASTIDVQKVDEATMISKVQELLNTKYTRASESGGEGTIQAGQEYKNSVYMIMAGSVRIENVSTLKAEIEKAKVAGNDLTLQVTDKGHKDVAGEIVATELTKNSHYIDLATDLTAAKTKLDAIDAAVKTAPAATATEATIVLANGNELDLVAGDYVLNLDKPVDANGNEINPTTADDATKKKIVGFKLAEGTEEVKDIPSKRVTDLTITSKVEVKENLADLYVKGQGYSQKGADLVNGLVGDAQTKTTTIVKDGTRYEIAQFTPGTDLGQIKAVKDGYELSIELEVRKDETNVSDLKGTKNVTTTIKSSSQSQLAEFRQAIIDNKAVAAGNVNTLAGEDRFETAVDVSKEMYLGKNETATATKIDKAKAIVLVGESAIVDGLAAAPLAAQEEAPILLTKKDAVPAQTMNEIKRLVAKGTEIYLVGGEANISKEVEKQLITEMNANIVRVAGEDRFETSLEIANKLTIKDNAFVVGGDGLADAMSIASLAATAKNPVIVTPQAGLTKDAKAFFKANTSSDVKVIGGETRIATQVLKDITDAKTGNNATRIAGEDRNDTNAKVIGSLAAASLDNVYVAKDGDDALVDALAAAPLTAKNKGAIVLATKDVTKAQQDKVKAAAKSTAKLTQVGGGVAATVIEKLVKVLGL